MKFFGIHLILLFSFLSVADCSYARVFVNGDIEIEMYYSHFNAKTTFVGTAQAKLRRSDDNFACIIKNQNVTYQCRASDAPDNLTWINISRDDLSKIMLTGLDPIFLKKSSNA